MTSMIENKVALIDGDVDPHPLALLIQDALEQVVMIQARRDDLGEKAPFIPANIREFYCEIGEICARLEGVSDLINYGESGTSIQVDFSTFVDIEVLNKMTDNISSVLAQYERG